jgi:hypothetical protein
MADVEDLRARVAVYAPGTKIKGLKGDAIQAASGHVRGEVVDAALARCIPVQASGQGLAVIGTEGLTVAHATKAAPPLVWSLPWADIAPVAVADNGHDFMFASPVDGLEGIAIFASGAQAALRDQVDVTERGPQRRYGDVAALGGLPGQEHPRSGVRLVVNDDGIAVDADKARLALLRWDAISGFAVEGPTEARKRVTVTRILALGVFALAVPKAESVSYLIVSLPGDREAAFEIRGVGPHQARADLLPFTSKVAGQLADTPVAAGDDLKSRLLRLEDLRSEGLISDDEYSEQRARILSEL